MSESLLTRLRSLRDDLIEEWRALYREVRDQGAFVHRGEHWFAFGERLGRHGVPVDVASDIATHVSSTRQKASHGEHSWHKLVARAMASCLPEYRSTTKDQHEQASDRIEHSLKELADQRRALDDERRRARTLIGRHDRGSSTHSQLMEAVEAIDQAIARHSIELASGGRDADNAPIDVLMDRRSQLVELLNDRQNHPRLVRYRGPLYVVSLSLALVLVALGEVLIMKNHTGSAVGVDRNMPFSFDSIAAFPLYALPFAFGYVVKMLLEQTEPILKSWRGWVVMSGVVLMVAYLFATWQMLVGEDASQPMALWIVMLTALLSLIAGLLLHELHMQLDARHLADRFRVELSHLDEEADKLDRRHDSITERLETLAEERALAEREAFESQAWLAAITAAEPDNENHDKATESSVRGGHETGSRIRRDGGEFPDDPSSLSEADAERRFTVASILKDTHR